MEAKILEAIKQKEFNNHILFISLMEILKSFGYDYNQCWKIQNGLCKNGYLVAKNRYGKISTYEIKF